MLKIIFIDLEPEDIFMYPNINLFLSETNRLLYKYIIFNIHPIVV
jgi:hypothetical protein